MTKLPRFSLRALAIIVTLICAYFAAWEATKRYGVQHVSTTLQGEDTAINVQVFEAWSTIPLVVGCDAQFDEMRDVDGRRYAVNSWVQRTYYLWLFGPAVKLPIDADSAHTVSGSGLRIGGGGMGGGLSPESRQ